MFRLRESNSDYSRASSSAFLVVNSCSLISPLDFKSPSRSMAANTFPSKAAAAGCVKLACGVTGCEYAASTTLQVRSSRDCGMKGAAGCEYAAGGVMGTDWPFREITGRVDRLMFPYWLENWIELPEPCCCEKPPIWWSSVSYTQTSPPESTASRRDPEK